MSPGHDLGKRLSLCHLCHLLRGAVPTTNMTGSFTPHASGGLIDTTRPSMDREHRASWHNYPTEQAVLGHGRASGGLNHELGFQLHCQTLGDPERAVSRHIAVICGKGWQTKSRSTGREEVGGLRCICVT